MIEVCCGSYEDAIAASQGGATRIELNSGLALGGLTPSTASLALTKQNLGVSIIAMVRPRAAGFCYSGQEYIQMIAEAEELLEAGADGIAFGFLGVEQTIDRNRTKEFATLVHTYHKEAVFHRAFDCVEGVDEGIQTLIALGVDRVLTSGQASTAEEGMLRLSYLQKTYGNEIQILAGSGINAGNIERIKENTGIAQFHSSCKEWKEDITTVGAGVSFAYQDGARSHQYEVVSKELVEKLIQIDS